MILQLQASVTKNTITTQYVLNSQVEDWSSGVQGNGNEVKRGCKLNTKSKGGT
jgi:hypothetical protein